MNRAEFEAEAKKRKMKVVNFSLTENDEDEELLGRGKIEKGRATLQKGKKEIKIEWEWRHTEHNYECVAREGYNNFTIEEHSYPDADSIFSTIGY